MPSANGYKLEVDGYTLPAVWPAPYFVLCRSIGPDDTPDEPLLIHCENWTHAQIHRRSGVILDRNFESV